MKDLLIEKMYELSKKPYQKLFKKNLPWKSTKKELLSLPQESLGFHLGCFLIQHHFEIQPKLEDHDVIHVLTKTGISVQDEIGMQYYLLGNGKKSLYLFLVLISGTCFYPTQFSTFMKQYYRGKNALSFHYLDFSKMLLLPVQQLRDTFKIK